MSLINELSAFVVAISKENETKKNKAALVKIINKYKNNKGECVFCGNKLKDGDQ
jgi:hypothetical protein